jgi:hypothetical protein
MLEQNIKQILGEMAFNLAALQTQLAEVTKERDELKAKKVKNEG